MSGPSSERVERVDAEAPQHERRDDGGGDDTADHALDVLDGEMWVRNFVRPKVLPTRYAPVSYAQTANTSSRIQPRSAPRHVERRVARHGAGPVVAEADDERQQRDVERAEHGRHPRLEAVARLVDGEARRRRSSTIPTAASSSALPPRTIG